MKTLSYILSFLFLVTLISCNKDDYNGIGSVQPNDFLSADKYDRLIVEIQYVEGFAPTDQAVDNLVDFLSERLNKPEGISVVKYSIPAPGNSSYSLREIRELEDEIRNERTQRNTIATFFFFADQGFSGDGSGAKTLGIAYGPTSMVIFEKTIKDFSGGITQPSRDVLESTVIQHEFGHTLGLVNNGSAMQSQHQDHEHGRHCDVEDCLMYYTASTSDIVGNLIGGNIPELDTQCIADLQANGGK